MRTAIPNPVVRISVAVLAVFAVVVVGLHTLAAAPAGDDRYFWADLVPNGRAMRIGDALPVIASRDEPTHVVVGSSGTTLGFVPDAFDAALHAGGVEGDTFNLSIPAATPEVQWLLARRLRLELEAMNHRVGIAVLPFPHDMATVETGENYGGRSLHSWSALARWEDLPTLAAVHPTRAVDLLSLRLVYGGTRSLELQKWVFGGARRRPSASSSPEEVAALYQMDVFNHFSIERRGAFPEPPTSDFFERGAAMMRARRDRLVRGAVARHDILSLNFDPYQIDRFVAAVGELAAVSDTTVVVMMPLRQEWLAPNDEGASRLAQTLASIRERTGAVVVDLFSEAADEDFLDHTHLRPDTAAPAVSAELARRILATR